MAKNQQYKEQMRLSMLNLAGEVPNFAAMLFSVITTRAVLLFVDLIDTSGNVLRNLLILLISKKLTKNLKREYNYGVGKIEAMVSLFCDTVMVLSLLVMMVFAVLDLFDPRPAGEFLIYVVGLKFIGCCCDTYMYIKQRRLCRESNNLVFQSAFSVATKNLVFDLTTFIALILMQSFQSVRAFWYISPVVSLGLGGYLLWQAYLRLRVTVGSLLDKSLGGEWQDKILTVLNRYDGRFDQVTEIRSRVSGDVTFVDMGLQFSEETTFAQIRALTNELETDMRREIPNCEVALRIEGIGE